MAILDKTTVHEGQGLSLQGTFENEKAITFALNMIKDDHTGGMPSYQSEPGNSFVKFLPIGYSLVGYINGKDDEVYLFSTNNTSSEIGVFKQDKYDTIVNTNLGFNTKYPITGEYRVKNGCDDIIYWCDHLNPDRWFNFSKPDDFKTGINWDVDKFSFNPTIIHPNILLESVNDTGGNLEVGSYYFQFKFLDSSSNVIFKSDITPQVVIYDDSVNNNYLEIDGAVNYPLFDKNAGGIDPTSKSISFKFNNLDSIVSTIEVTVILETTSSNKKTGYNLGTTINTKGSSSIKWTFTGLSSDDTITDVTETLIPLASYSSSYVMEQVQNRLVRANLKGEDIDYAVLQKHTIDNVTLDWYAEEIEIANNNVGLPTNAITYWDRTTFQSDEIYAFGIQYMINGKWSPVFHKPNRFPLSQDTDFLLVVANGVTLNPNEVWLSDVEHLPQSYFQFWNSGYLGSTISRWKVFNTADLDISQTTQRPYFYRGSFGYYESEEVYPDIKDCNGNSVFGSYTGTKVKYHRFPDRRLITHLKEDYILPLGVRIIMSSLPPDATAYRLVYYNVSTVVETGYLDTENVVSVPLSGDPDKITLNGFFGSSGGSNYASCSNITTQYESKLSNAQYLKLGRVFNFDTELLPIGDFLTLTTEAGNTIEQGIIRTNQLVQSSIPLTENYKLLNQYFIDSGSTSFISDLNLEIVNNDYWTNYSILKTQTSIENFDSFNGGQIIRSVLIPGHNEFRNKGNTTYFYKKVLPDPVSIFAVNYCYSTLNPITDLAVAVFGGDKLLTLHRTVRLASSNYAILNNGSEALTNVWETISNNHLWVESDKNSNLRYKGLTDEFYYLKNSWPLFNLDFLKKYTERVDTGGTVKFRIKVVDEWIPEYYKLNLDYDKECFQQPKVTLSKFALYCSDCTEYYPNRIIFSPVSFREEIEDKYRTNLVNDYIDIPGHRGAIKGLKFRSNMLFVHCDDGTFILQPNPQVVATDQSQAYITTGDFLSIPAQELQQTDLGFAGCQSKQAYFTNEFQHNWVDQKRGQIFGYDNNLKIMSDIGLTQWFKENLPSNTINQVFQLYDIKLYPTSTIPDFGYGVHVYFDPRFKRLFITKIDRTAIGAITSTTRTGMYFNGESWDYYVDGVLVTSNVPTTDTSKFENNSWTISYDFRYNRWISWHSYLPYISFADNRHFYSLIHTQKNNIYKHLHFNNYHRFYSGIFDAIIEFQTFDIQTDKLTSVHYQGYTYIWDNTTKQWLEHNETFNKLICYNHNQSTGLQNLQVLTKAQPYANTILSTTNKYVIKTDQNYKISGLYDMATTQPVMSQRWTDIVGYGSFIDKMPVNINYNKDPYTIGKLSDKYVNTRLFFRPVTDSKIIILLTQIQEQYSIR